MSKSGPIHDLLTALPLWAKLAITQQAANNVDPESLVDHVLALVPDDALDKLAEAIESVDDATEEIVLRIPKWIPYKAWLRKLVAAIAARLVEELKDTDETAVSPVQDAGT